jgi:hypothetical protein
MGVGFTPALAGAFCQSDGLIDGRKRRLDLARLCFRLSKGRLKERHIEGVVHLVARGDAAAHCGEATLPVAQMPSRPRV